jgi:hypothetical protein
MHDGVFPSAMKADVVLQLEAGVFERQTLIIIIMLPNQAIASTPSASCFERQTLINLVLSCWARDCSCAAMAMARFVRMVVWLQGMPDGAVRSPHSSEESTQQ